MPITTAAAAEIKAILERALGHISTQLELVRGRREALEQLEAELVAKRRKASKRLAELAERLRRTRLTVPLFDTELFTRHLEDAYLQMYQRSARGLSPHHLHVVKGSRAG